MEVLEQPGSEARVHNVVTIREWRRAKVDKQRILADLSYFAQRRSLDHTTFQCFASGNASS